MTFVIYLIACILINWFAVVLLSDLVAIGSPQQEVINLSPLIGPFLPTTHTHDTHTPVGFYQFELLCFPQFWFWSFLFFLLAILSAFRPLSLSEQVKNKDPPKIATKVTPPFIHLSLCPSILPVAHPPPHPPPSGRRGVSSPSCPSSPPPLFSFSAV